MPDQVPVHVARQRNQILRTLGAAKHAAFLNSFVGKDLDAITLGQTHRDAGACTDALTDNYLKLRLSGLHDPNRWLPVRVGSVRDETLVGVVAKSVAAA
jgi:tRNA A37 methylthiotransferase MiaB